MSPKSRIVPSVRSQAGANTRFVAFAAASESRTSTVMESTAPAGIGIAPKCAARRPLVRSRMFIALVTVLYGPWRKTFALAFAAVGATGARAMTTCVIL